MSEGDFTFITVHALMHDALEHVRSLALSGEVAVLSATEENDGWIVGVTPLFAIVSEGPLNNPPTMGDRLIVRWPRTPAKGVRMVVHGVYHDKPSADRALLRWAKHTDTPARRIT